MDFSRDIVGIIAEYNPFHAGHLRHLQETRKRVGEDAVIVVAMSGNFTQRGEPAIWDKWLRARVAVDHGANLVVELPVYYALSAAQDFAYGGVKLLEALGAQYLSFGSEDADVARLLAFAQKKRDAQFNVDLRHHLSKGESYPKAMELAGMPSTPNAILGVEYLSQTTKLQPIVIERPQNHSSEILGSIPTLSSARAMRAYLKDLGSMPPCTAMPNREYHSMHCTQTPSTTREAEISCAIRSVSGIDYSPYPLKPILTNGAFALIALAALRTAEPSKLAESRGAAEGIEHRLIEAAQKSKTFDELVERASSKRFTMARIRRILYSYLLGMKHSRLPEPPRYARILGFDTDGQKLIRALRDFYKEENRKKNEQEEKDPSFTDWVVPFTIINKLSRDRIADPFLELDIKAAALYSAVLGEPTDEYSRIPYMKCPNSKCPLK